MLSPKRKGLHVQAGKVKAQNPTGCAKGYDSHNSWLRKCNVPESFLLLTMEREEHSPFINLHVSRSSDWEIRYFLKA